MVEKYPYKEVSRNRDPTKSTAAKR